MHQNILSQLYAATIGRILNFISDLLPSAVDRATAAFTKADALLGKAEQVAHDRIANEFNLRTELQQAEQASLRRTQDAINDANRAQRIRARIAKLLD